MHQKVPILKAIKETLSSIFKNISVLELIERFLNGQIQNYT